MKVVCDASPLILLAKIGRLDLFLHLYEHVIIPTSVLDEIQARPGKETKAIRALLQNEPVEIKQASQVVLKRVPADLGTGERAAIALAIETKADLVILDDQQGRRIAQERDLSITGTIGVLIEAHGRNMIPSLPRELDRLIETGMWIDEVFYQRILQEFEE